MESLELPQEIIWVSDQPPTLSPEHITYANPEEILIFEDSFATELLISEELTKPQKIFDFSYEEFEQLLEIQEELEETMSEEASNDQWLDQPINVPIDEGALILDARVYPVKGNTVQLLNEFKQVYDAVEFTHLTPPETPPQTPPQTPLQSYLIDSAQNQFQPLPINSQWQFNQPMVQCKLEDKHLPNYPAPYATQQYPTILEQAISMVQHVPQMEYVDNIDIAMAEVEALVRLRAEDINDSSLDDDSSSNGSSSCFSPRSETSSSSTDDSDWTLKTPSSIATAIKAKQAKKTPMGQKRKPRVNRRSPEDRQSRKKEQNKTAANRYRMKKKAEIEILLDEKTDLMKHNEALRTKYENVAREVRYIRNLLRDLYKAKGLIK